MTDKMKDYSKFTPREIDVLRLMAQGFNNRQINEKLCVELCTTKTYINRIYEKLGLIDEQYSVNRVLAVLYYLENKEVLEK